MKLTIPIKKSRYLDCYTRLFLCNWVVQSNFIFNYLLVICLHCNAICLQYLLYFQIVQKHRFRITYSDYSSLCQINCFLKKVKCKVVFKEVVSKIDYKL